MNKPLLEVSLVRVFYDDRPVLEDISFSLNYGERVALIGLNGSGKTTLLLSIVGLVRYEGEIRFKDKVISSSNVEQIREKTGFLFSPPDDQILFPTVFEDISFYLIKKGLSTNDAKTKVQGIAKELGIERHIDSYTFELSYGERLKVVLAGLLVMEPELLLLDEPTSGLDPVAKKRLEKTLLKHTSSQIIATHDINFASSVCNRFLLIDNGKIIREGQDFNEIERYWQEISD